ncbi:hypothetical protein DAPPUDRAFT_259680 [Daphnia pulex]|uniref:Uncharacterized protein n=1 Tax=Daphnia pulex TaxID=6669 RepID=E9HHN2_DAPPU|nr:hypothetical protein DAPPUDRAFT_259680 [Daphnia pulex]|eukprot:EFX68763.1 hypothetical protein DAPPUDRAFT_259680 [Daphnia pulex]
MAPEDKWVAGIHITFHIFFQFSQGLDVITNKVTLEERQFVHHHLIDSTSSPFHPLTGPSLTFYANHCLKMSDNLRTRYKKKLEEILERHGIQGAVDHFLESCPSGYYLPTFVEQVIIKEFFKQPLGLICQNKG